jgi:hypothetical protein
VSGGCFQFEEFQTYEAYDKWGISKSGMKTKLVEKKLMRDDAASLAYKYLIWHSVQLVDMGAAPSYDFKTATTALPLQLAGNEATYMEFVKDFGTHVMTQTYMGGLALVTTFFHECFYNYFSVETLVEIIEHHFGLFYHSSSTKITNTTKNDTLFEEWSETEVVIAGGDAASHASLWQNGSYKHAQVEAWESTVKDNKMVPIGYELKPLADFMLGWADPQVVTNVNKTIVNYFTAAGDIIKSLAKDLEPKDPHIKPKWCKNVGNESSQPAWSKLKESASERAKYSSFPSCPALPPLPPLAVRQAYENFKKNSGS